MQTRLRVRQRNIITVVMDVTYDVTFGQLDPQLRRYSTSRSTQISEIDPAGEDHGFLWRLNTYWTYEERDGGLYLQIEAVVAHPQCPTWSRMADPALGAAHPC